MESDFTSISFQLYSGQYPGVTGLSVSEAKTVEGHFDSCFPQGCNSKPSLLALVVCLLSGITMPNSSFKRGPWTGYPRPLPNFEV